MYYYLCIIVLYLLACGTQSELANNQNTSNPVDSDDNSYVDDISEYPRTSAELDAELLDRSVFPATKDLAIVLPTHQNQILATTLFNQAWFEQINQAFLSSDLAIEIQSENQWEDWKLVSIRIIPCAPLGKITDLSTEQMCWPQIHLTWQPVASNIMVDEQLYELYADNRAIQTIYYSQTQNIHLQTLTQHIASGGRWDDVEKTVKNEFYQSRIWSSLQVLDDVANLRMNNASDLYANFGMRPEYEQTLMEQDAWHQALISFLNEYCLPKSLFELNAFSKTIGRSSPMSNRWTFISFKNTHGILEQQDLDIFSNQDASLLYRFKASETVNEDLGDINIIQDLALMSTQQIQNILQQVVIDTDQLSYIQERLSDPYQILPHNTNCSSCHGIDLLQSSFHQFSYSKNQELYLSTRVVNSNKRDLWHAIKLWEKYRSRLNDIRND